MRKQITPPPPQKLYNLEEHNSQQNRFVSTKMWNVSYAMCKALMDRLRFAPLQPGTYFKIVESNKQQIA